MFLEKYLRTILGVLLLCLLLPALPVGADTSADQGSSTPERGDAYEDDNSCEQAQEITTVGFTQVHTFHQAGDEDWIRFQGLAGRTYVIRGQALGTVSNLALALFDRCGAPPALAAAGPAPGGDIAIIWSPVADGILYVQAVDAAGDYGTDTLYKLSVRQQIDGVAVIVGGRNDHDSLQTNIDNVTNRAYRAFRALGLPATSIYYLSPRPQDADGDGISDVRASSSPPAVGDAIQWAAGRVGPGRPLFLYMMDHGGVEYFCANGCVATGRITPDLLDTWLAELEDQSGCDQISVIVESDHAGSFIDRVGDAAQSISGTDRVVITSTSRDGNTYASAGGAVFADAFLPALAGGHSLLASFHQGRAAITAMGVPQTPWLDDNGNGIPSEVSDGALTLQRPQSIPPEEFRTLILYNGERLTRLFGPEATYPLHGQLLELAAEDRVRGLLVPLELDAAVASAYDAWDAHPAEASYANAVTAAIRQAILGYLKTYPQVTYLVLVGDDRVIPFRRVLDTTPTPESHYTDVLTSTTVGAALAADMTLTDNYYADLEFTPLDGHDLYLPDLAAGRLVETPAEIQGQIEAFLAYGPRWADEALVTGSIDYVLDLATSICSLLEEGSLTVDCSLVGLTWSLDAFRQRLLSDGHDLISLNMGGNHYSYDPPDGASLGSQELGASQTDLRGVLVYSMTSHAGLNVPAENPAGALDWPQAWGQEGTTYVASTGWTWGGAGIFYAEALVRNLTRELTRESASYVGVALKRAKHTYYERLHEPPTAYDEKTLLEFTLYGLPMAHLWARAAPAAPVLYAIDNPDYDGGYTVDWTDVPGATFYGLQVDSSASFAAPLPVYQGEESSFAVVDQSAGIWYYRVQALNFWGSGSWSNVETVTVMGPGRSKGYLPVIARDE